MHIKNSINLSKKTLAICLNFTEVFFYMVVHAVHQLQVLVNLALDHKVDILVYVYVPYTMMGKLFGKLIIFYQLEIIKHLHL